MEEKEKDKIEKIEEGKGEKEETIEEKEQSNNNIIEYNINLNSEKYILYIYLTKRNSKIIFKLEEKDVKTCYYYEDCDLYDLKRKQKRFNKCKDLQEAFICLKEIFENNRKEIRKDKIIMILEIYYKNSFSILFEMRKKIVCQKKINLLLINKIKQQEEKIMKINNDLEQLIKENYDNKKKILDLQKLHKKYYKLKTRQNKKVLKKLNNIHKKRENNVFHIVTFIFNLIILIIVIIWCIFFLFKNNKEDSLENYKNKIEEENKKIITFINKVNKRNDESLSIFNKRILQTENVLNNIKIMILNNGSDFYKFNDSDIYKISDDNYNYNLENSLKNLSKIINMNENDNKNYRNITNATCETNNFRSIKSRVEKYVGDINSTNINKIKNFFSSLKVKKNNSSEIDKITNINSTILNNNNKNKIYLVDINNNNNNNRLNSGEREIDKINISEKKKIENKIENNYPKGNIKENLPIINKKFFNPNNNNNLSGRSKTEKKNLIYFPESEIITSDGEVEFLIRKLKQINYDQKIIFQLKYRASRDGDDAEDFHRFCDDIGPNIVLIKSKKGIKFGGFTQKNWGGYANPENSYFKYGIQKEDTTAFCFSITKKKIYKQNKNNKFAITARVNNGPIFRRDIFRAEDSFLSEKMGFCNDDMETFIGEENKCEISGGEEEFDIEELEVFEVILI